MWGVTFVRRRTKECDIGRSGVLGSCSMGGGPTAVASAPAVSFLCMNSIRRRGYDGGTASELIQIYAFPVDAKFDYLFWFHFLEISWAFLGRELWRRKDMGAKRLSDNISI